MPFISNFRTIAICILIFAPCISANDSAIGQDQTNREKSVQTLLDQVESISPAFRQHVEEFRVDGESDEEVAEICAEFLDEFNEIKSDSGANAAGLWVKLMVAESKVERLIEDAYDDELNLEMLKEKVLELVDADIEFEAAEIERMDEDDVIEEFLEEIGERRENRLEERDELLEEILAELENGDHEGENPDEDSDDDEESIDGMEESEFLDKDLFDDTPVQPVTVTAAEISKAGQSDFTAEILPVLSSACYDCHGNGSNEGNLDIETLLTELPLVKNRERWNHVIAQIENRTMPPSDANKVADENRKIIAAWMRDQLENFDFSSIRNPGFESAKRLTHEEYNNTIRDLVGIDLRPAERLPADLSTSGGFDNNANSLFLHDGLLERYVGLAESVTQRAFPAGKRNSKQQTAWNLLFVATPDVATTETEAARAIFESFLPRVYRSKVDFAEIDAMVQRFHSYRNKQADFYTAILKCVQTTLVSPRFLLRVESGQQTNQAYRVDAYELANRLSYFLWASMPDERLFGLAESGELLRQEIINVEVQRMLADPKAETLGSNFAAQWLGFEHLGSRIRLDPIDNPWCTDSLMDAMKSETGLFFASLIRDNRPLVELIDPDFTYLNEELARFYGIPDIHGEQMRMVTLSSKRRGGIFAQSSILAVTSFPDRTSPVTRGAWVLTNVLGKRPPNPPPNASQLNEEIEERDSLTQRQKMELHRRKTNCAACHNQIDPLGFALENYDLFGRYRTRTEGRRINANSVLIDGTEIDGLIGLKSYVENQKMREVLTQLTRQMLAYSLGRQLEYYDEAAVQKIVADVITDDWQMRTLVLGIVNSYPFQYKQTQVESSENNDSGGGKQ